MSHSASSAQDPVSGSGGFASTNQGYQLSDDLARLCLPHEFQDTCRTLAWVNSICFLFLVVGLVGLKPPRVIHKPLNEVVENVPVIFTPPEEPPKSEPDVKPDEPDQPQDNPQEMPQVVTVVAAADPSSVAFSVPVQGAVAIASAAHLATPPPLVSHPAAPVKFNQNVGDGGNYPSPMYPSIAERNHYQGTVVVEGRVDEKGNLVEAKIQKSSGYPALDDAALDIVKRRWRFPTGKPQWFYWPCMFKLLE